MVLKSEVTVGLSGADMCVGAQESIPGLLKTLSRFKRTLTKWCVLCLKLTKANKTTSYSYATVTHLGRSA
jgi:hypothetical protein